MSHGATIVSIIAVCACLILASRSSVLRRLGTRRAIGLAVIWAAIIAGLALVIHVAGIRVAG